MRTKVGAHHAFWARADQLPNLGAFRPRVQISAAISASSCLCSHLDRFYDIQIGSAAAEIA